MKTRLPTQGKARAATLLAAWLVALAAALLACGSDAAGPEPSDGDAASNDDAAAQSAQDAFFDLGHRVEVEVELADTDWAALRQQGRGLIAAFTGQAADYEYGYFDASVVVDGQRYDNVAVRKKGFVGSLSADRPSIKIDLDRTREGQRHLGLERLTLNNDRQDPSHTHQCLAYRLFARAGVPASRCNLAHVVVNGEDLGTYSNVEPVKKPMLARHFSSNEGNLYEGQVADFSPEQVGAFQLKTNEAENDRSDLGRVVDALESDDEGLVVALEGAIDLDGFRTFWALETLVGHWDGYAGNRNNYYVYNDPSVDRLVFLPWGTDSAFEVANPFDPVNTSVSVYAGSRLANRLYSLPDQRRAFRERLGELLDELWDEDALLAEVDQIESLAPDATPAALSAQRARIASHPVAVRSELAGEAPEWIDLGGGAPSECGGVSTVTGTFETTWDSLNAGPGAGQFSLDVNVDGAPLDVEWFGGAGIDATLGAGVPRVRFISVLGATRVLVVDLQMSERTFAPGITPLHGIETVGFLSLIDGLAFNLGGFVGDGQIELDQASTEAGAAVSGRFTGQLLQLGCLGL